MKQTIVSFRCIILVVSQTMGRYIQAHRFSNYGLYFDRHTLNRCKSCKLNEVQTKLG
jgi:hypothetical protein